MAQRSTESEYGRGALVVSLLSVPALAVLGFHPYAEDGGLYVAGIEKLLDPGLFAGHAEFVEAHLRFSPFAYLVAAWARVVPLPWVLLGLYCASVWATLFAGWMLAARCFAGDAARYGAVMLLACSMSMPIAGTSLMMMDPYVTARSLSTPLAMAALAWAMDGVGGSRKGALLCAAALVLAMVHPLMAGYALAAVAATVVAGSERKAVRRWGWLVLGAIALAVAGTVQAMAPAESAAYGRAAITRYFWFPLRWQWYEQIGLIAPMVLIYWMTRVQSRPSQRTRWMGYAALMVGAIALAVALLFARAGAETHLVARMQPLRCFQMVYEVLILLLGAWLAERWLGRRAWRWSAAFVVLGGVMFFVQRSTFPASRHFELPGVAPRDPWSQAFVWVRHNTPRNALFALDPHYITESSEDAQGFRGISERSALPDYSKDGGEASITPQLAQEWAAGVEAQTGLNGETDAARSAKLKPLGVDWVVVRAASGTGWSCPYANAVVKACRMP